MKIQDILFLIVVFALFYKQNPKWFVLVGLLCLVLAVPLFSMWIFFTAERLTWYASAFFLLAIIFYLFKSKNE